MDILGLGALRTLEPQDWFPLLFSDLGSLTGQSGEGERAPAWWRRDGRTAVKGGTEAGHAVGNLGTPSLVRALNSGGAGG
jgi:hypothetical protein